MLKGPSAFRRLSVTFLALLLGISSCATRSGRVTETPVVPTSLVPNGPGDIGTGRCTFTVGAGRGALVSDILPAGPAVDVLAIDDVVKAFDGVEIRTSADLVDAVRERSVGDTVTLEGIRDGQPLTVEVTLGESAEVAGRAVLGVMVATFEERLEPDQLEAANIDDPLSRVVAISGRLWVLDPVSIAWSPLDIPTPTGALIVSDGEIYTVEVAGVGAAQLIGAISGEVITVDLAEWTAVSIMGSMGSLALLGAERRDAAGEVMEYGIIAVDPAVGAARWVWITEPDSPNPVPRAGYRSIDGETVLVALGSPESEGAGLWILLREVGGQPTADVAAGIPAEAQMVGWHDATRVIAVIGPIDQPTIIDPVTGTTVESTLPVTSPAVRMWAVGDGGHVLVEDGDGLVLAEVGGAERRLLTASCGPAVVTEVGWILG